MKKTVDKRFTFTELVSSIQSVHNELLGQAKRAVNISLTLRNWLIGCYIAEYEMRGADRAKYGDRLMGTLAETLTKQGVSRCDRRELYRYRQFYLMYPQIVEALTPQFMPFLNKPIRQTPVSLSGAALEGSDFKIVESPTPKSKIDGKTLISKFSFTHIVELLNIEDTTKRGFYEIECIRGTWPVRELKRQIDSLYYERSGLSRNKKKLAELAQTGAEQTESHVTIRDPYIFEFLGLKAKEVMGESHLEDVLLDKLQEFLLELGHGFCFEARQKRILIGDTHNFVDLVFYHRILKCHVLVELKLAGFSHENIGQLNTYVSWYAKNVMTDTDNPPIGILLCTRKDHALVEYALAGLDNQLFVSKYQLELPKQEDMQRFIEEQIKEARL